MASHFAIHGALARKTYLEGHVTGQGVSPSVANRSLSAWILGGCEASNFQTLAPERRSTLRVWKGLGGLWGVEPIDLWI